MKIILSSFLGRLLNGSSRFEFALISLFFCSLMILVLPNIGKITILHFLYASMAFVIANTFWLILAFAFLRKANNVAFIVSHSLTIFFLIINAYHYTIFEEHFDFNSIFVAITGILSGEAKIGLGNYLVFFKQGFVVAVTIGFVLTIFLLFPLSRKGNPYSINFTLTLCFICLLSLFKFFPLKGNEQTLISVQEAIPFIVFYDADTKYPLEQFNLSNISGTRDLEEKQIIALSQLREDLIKMDLKAERKPNILFLHLESLRSDMLSPVYMPNLYQWGNTKGEILPHHYSTASNTTTGMFGLIHGLAGSYFQSAEIDHYYPITLDILENIDYSIATYHGKSLDYDNMYRRFFKATRDYDYWPRHGNTIDNDADVLHRLILDIKNNQSNSKPRFDYVKLDSTHWNYAYPPEFEKHLPVIPEDFHISSMTNLHMKTFSEELLNRYKNSAGYMDHIVGEFLKEAEEIGFLENSIIIITGDHGEEFWEHNRFGHIYGLSKEQIHVAGLVYFPEKLNTQYKTTSHQDIFPSIFSYMDLNIDPSFLFSGKNLYEYDKEKDFSVISLGTIGSMNRYTEAVISGDLKVEYRLKEKEFEITKISNTTDIELNNFSKSDVKSLILKSINMKKTLPSAKFNIHLQ